VNSSIVRLWPVLLVGIAVIAAVVLAAMWASSSERNRAAAFFAGLIGVAAGCVCTWLLWSFHFTGRVYALWIAALPVYTAVILALLGDNKVHIAIRLFVAILCLLVTVLVGSVIAEIIHCSYDRAGCINL
jgi:hypothetical protein